MSKSVVVDSVARIKIISNLLTKHHGQQISDIWEFGINTPLHISELLNIRFADVVGERLEVAGRTPIQLNRKAVSIVNRLHRNHPTHKYLFQSHRNRQAINRAAHPISRRYVTKAFTDVGRILKIPLTPKTMRKTHGYHLYKSTGDVGEVMKVLRQPTVEKALCYIGLEAELTKPTYNTITLGDHMENIPNKYISRLASYMLAEGTGFPFFMNFSLPISKRGTVRIGGVNEFYATAPLEQFQGSFDWEQFGQTGKDNVVKLTETTKRLSKYMSPEQILEYYTTGFLPETIEKNRLTKAVLKDLRLEWAFVPSALINPHTMKFVTPGVVGEDLLHVYSNSRHAMYVPDVLRNVRVPRTFISSYVHRMHDLHINKRVNAGCDDRLTAYKNNHTLKQESNNMYERFSEIEASRYGLTYPFYIAFGLDLDSQGRICFDVGEHTWTLSLDSPDEDVALLRTDRVIDNYTSISVTRALQTYRELAEHFDENIALTYLTEGVFPGHLTPRRLLTTDDIAIAAIEGYSIEESSLVDATVNLSEYIEEPQSHVVVTDGSNKTYLSFIPTDCNGENVETYMSGLVNFISRHYDAHYATAPLDENDDQLRDVGNIPNADFDGERLNEFFDKPQDPYVPPTEENLSITYIPKQQLISEFEPRLPGTMPSIYNTHGQQLPMNSHLNTHHTSSLERMNPQVIGGYLFGKLAAGEINAITHEQIEYLKEYIQRGTIAIEVVPMGVDFSNEVIFKATLKLSN